MAQQITAWRSLDGRIHETQQAAINADLQFQKKTDIEKVIEELPSVGLMTTYGFTLETKIKDIVKKQRDEGLDLFAGISLAIEGILTEELPP